MKRTLFQAAPIFVLDAMLLMATNAWGYLQSIEFANPYGVNYQVLIFPFLFLMIFIAVGIIESIWHVRDFVDEDTGRVSLYALWNSTVFKTSPINGILITLLIGGGVMACANFSEIYRATVINLHDEGLWRIEEPLIVALLDSRVNVPELWDAIYFLIWPLLFLAMVLMYKVNHEQKFVQLALAVVISFCLTRCINLLFPTAGPAFFHSELFQLGGTASERVQAVLRLYMEGQVSQNGLMPGTMAMPSLHVGLIALASWFLASEWRWTLWLTLPWLFLIWLSTIILGWHYALDGVGGMLVVWMAVLMARYALDAWNFLIRFRANR